MIALEFAVFAQHAPQSATSNKETLIFFKFFAQLADGEGFEQSTEYQGIDRFPNGPTLTLASQIRIYADPRGHTFLSGG